ncbi:hypothetical protein T8S45_04875 [Blastomonas marina]|jgi:hypothetical protein|uniref:Uncharacterized protein n=1 Tax=Blastomonas marina TaxID=1867408 RepID=A0ABQ1FAX8_9SPHN|nr:hypothetical protein [Blastomonas marina]WPZ04874.1 hypothetical protein T8S45_04875 [Blastomonas marina]GGA04657.1 hypothetical protein GCM10010923_12620 [Blastomonas marina]
MAGRIGKGMWVAIGAVLLLAILVLAWIDGGEREIELIVEDIPVPEGAR